MEYRWLWMLIIIAVNLLGLPSALALTTSKTLTFELLPLPVSSERITWLGLKNYWFTVNENNRPFSINPGGILKVLIHFPAFDVVAFREHIQNILLRLESGNRSHLEKLFMLTHPRLYCLYRQSLGAVSQDSCGGALLSSLSSSPHSLNTSMIDLQYMTMESRILIKVFQLQQWQQLVREERILNTVGNCVYKGWCKVDGRKGELSSGIDLRRICRTPSLYTYQVGSYDTVYLYSFRSPTYHHSHFVLVIAQCSDVPFSVDVTVVASNPDGKGDNKQFLTQAVYSLFLIPYICLLLLLIVMSCMTSYQFQTMESLAASTSDGGSVSSTLRGSTENRSTEDTASGVDKSQISRCDARCKSWGQKRFNCALFRSCGRSLQLFWCRVRELCTKHFLVMCPELQWIVVFCIIGKIVVFVLRLLQLRPLVLSQSASVDQGSDIAAVILTLCIRSVEFAMQQFVCLGWGCAYERPSVAKNLIATIASFLGFVAYALESTCDSIQMEEFTFMLSESIYFSDIRCVNICIIRHVCELVGALLNVFQLNALTKLLGRAARTGVGFTHVGAFGSTTSLYMRYSKMVFPYALGTLVPQLIFIIASQTFIQFDDHYLEVATDEFVQCFVLVFVVIFLRRSPFYI